MKGDISNINNIKLISETKYNELSTSKKNNGTIYLVKSDDGSTAKIYKNGIDYTSKADSAIKATQDGNGKVIADTYLPKTGGVVSGDTTINGLRTLRYYKNNNSGQPTYLLLFEISNWWNNNSNAISGFNGNIYSFRTNGYLSHTGMSKIIMACGYKRNSVVADDGLVLFLRSDKTNFKPCIIHDTVNDKYYLSLKISGADRNMIFNGIIYGTPLNIQIDATDSSGTLPDGYEFMVEPDKYYPLVYSRAKEDASGNVITDTYAKKSIYDDTAVSMGRKAGTTIGTNSFAYGLDVEASGDYAHAEGSETTASGHNSHTEGFVTTASGSYAHAEGLSTNKATDYVNSSSTNDEIITAWNALRNSGIEPFSLAKGDVSHIEGWNCLALGPRSHAEGTLNIAIGNESHVEGLGTKTPGHYSHAEGCNTTASGNYSHAEGACTTASGLCSSAEGEETIASGHRSHAEGYKTQAISYSSHAEGCATTAGSSYAHAEGYSTIALINQHAQGHFNNTTNATDNSIEGTSGGTAFVIGNGTESSRSNAFRVTGEGVVYATNAAIQTGADYAEYFEWVDGNQNEEDRVGYFVTFDEDNPEKIRIANEDDYILGIVSGMPSVIGNGDECWKQRYILDDFGRYITETFEYELVVGFDDEGNEIKETKIGTKWKENPEYDQAKPYTPRAERAEWNAIGMMGVLSVYDDGTCQVNGYCKCTNSGIATACEKEIGAYRVIKRVTDNIVKVVLK